MFSHGERRGQRKCISTQPKSNNRKSDSSRDYSRNDVVVEERDYIFHLITFKGNLPLNDFYHI